MSDTRPVIVKVGGSLFDLPDLGPRLREWLDANGLVEVILVPGGGPLVDEIRRLDRLHNLGEEASHWLAVQALTVNASFLARVLPGGVVTQDPNDCIQHWQAKQTPVLDPWPFVTSDEGKPGSLPHSWGVTSDSIAARVAVVMGAPRLILLKSTTGPEGMDWAEAGRRGIVDKYFEQVIQGANIRVHAVNLRR